MHPVVEETYAKADHGISQSAISAEEGAFLHSLVASRNITSSIEVGCAFGLSSIHICLAMKERPGARHTIVDPFQTSEYKRAGVRLLERGGIGFFNLIEKPSEFALPALAEAGMQFDFCFIDGYHTFDQTMIDFYYLNRMLRPGGILAIDDISHPAVNKAAKYIVTYPCYRIVGAVGRRGKQRAALNAAKAVCSTVLSPLLWLAGEQMGHEFLDTTIVRPRVRKGLDTCTLVAFEKVSEDNQRNTNWFRHI